MMKVIWIINNLRNILMSGNFQTEYFLKTKKLLSYK